MILSASFLMVAYYTDIGQTLDKVQRCVVSPVIPRINKALSDFTLCQKVPVLCSGPTECEHPNQQRWPKQLMLPPYKSQRQLTQSICFLSTGSHVPNCTISPGTENVCNYHRCDKTGVTLERRQPPGSLPVPLSTFRPLSWYMCTCPAHEEAADPDP